MGHSMIFIVVRTWESILPNKPLHSGENLGEHLAKQASSQTKKMRFEVHVSKTFEDPDMNLGIVMVV